MRAKVVRDRDEGRSMPVIRSEEGDAWRATQARRWLRSVRAARERARAAREMADAQREALDGIRGIDYASDAVSSGAGDDAVMRAVSAMQAAVRSYVVAEVEATEFVADAFERLSRLDAPLACRILTLHYLRGLTWGQVGDGLFGARHPAPGAFGPRRRIRRDAAWDARPSASCVVTKVGRFCPPHS